MSSGPPYSCPICDSDEIEALPVDPGISQDLNVFMQTCNCKNCNAEWEEHFHFVGYEMVDEPDGEPDRDEPVGAIDREASRYEQNIRGGL